MTSLPWPAGGSPPSKRTIAVVALCLAPLAWGGWTHWRAAATRADIAEMDRALADTRAQTAAARRTLVEMDALVDDWTRAWDAGRFAPLDRSLMARRLPDLSATWRVRLSTRDMPPADRLLKAPGLERVTQTLRLSAEGFLDGDLLAFLDDMAQGGRVESLSLRRLAPLSEDILAMIRQGEDAPLVAMDATIAWESWSWRTTPGPAAPAPQAPPPIPPMEGGALLSADDVERITTALRAGAWGRAPGWRDLEDLTLTGLVYAGPESWMLWINGAPVEDLQPMAHVSITGVEPDGVALVVDRGPDDKAEVFLKPSWTYRVFEGRLDRAP
jgi:hypothetical protein